MTGYPTLKWFDAKSTTPEDFNGDRDAKGLTKFINDKIGSKLVVKEPATNVTRLSSSTFDKIVMDDSDCVLVKFFAPWYKNANNVI